MRTKQSSCCGCGGVCWVTVTLAWEAWSHGPLECCSCSYLPRYRYTCAKDFIVLNITTFLFHRPAVPPPPLVYFTLLPPPPSFLLPFPPPPNRLFPPPLLPLPPSWQPRAKTFAQQRPSTCSLWPLQPASHCIVTRQKLPLPLPPPSTRTSHLRS